MPINMISILPRAFKAFEGPMFSPAAKAIDKTLLPPDAVAELDKNLKLFLRLLGPNLLEAPAGKALQWLVRKTRRALGQRATIAGFKEWTALSLEARVMFELCRETVDARGGASRREAKLS